MSDTLTGTGRKAKLSELNLYHRNPRVGNVDVIKGSLRAHGQYKPVLINLGTHTGRPNEVLAGNHTVKAIRDLAEEYPEDDRWQEVDVWEIDVDDDRAARIVLADNRTAELGRTDDDQLLELLQELDDLDGTGYVDEDLDDLVALLQETEEPEDSDDEGPRVGEDGLIRSNDLEHDGDAYSNTATRIIILTLGIDRFVWAQEKMEEYRKEFRLPTNTDVMIDLLEKWSGETAPEEDEPENVDDDLTESDLGDEDDLEDLDDLEALGDEDEL